MTHLVITGSRDGGNVSWKEKVSDEEYFGDRQTKTQASAMPADKSSLEVGKPVQTELAGQPVTGPLFDFAPAINTYLQSHLFGDLFGRGILDYPSREIVTLSALANIAGVEVQLKAHIGVATNVGLTEAQLSSLADVLKEHVGLQAGHRARQALQAVP